MREIRYTLLSDGTSDKALLPLIDWVIRQHFPDLVVQSEWADLSLFGKPSGGNLLAGRVRQALDFYPCDWLFVHRDAEKMSISERHDEIEQAWQTVQDSISHEQLVCVIPVRMMETWLLFDEFAIRKAAGNPNGRQPIQLPLIKRWEGLPDPKHILKEVLRQATGLTGRRLANFNEARAIQLVADNIADFTPLRHLNAFRLFESMISRLAPV